MMQRNATDRHAVVRMVNCRASGYLLQYVFNWYTFVYLAIERQFYLRVNRLATPPHETCPEMHANEMCELYDRHHKVSPILNPY